MNIRWGIWMRRIAIVTIVLLSIFLFSNNVYPESTGTIDSIVKKLSETILKTIPDRADNTIAVNNFLSDQGMENLLGKRLKTLLELELASHYRYTKVVQSYKKRPSYEISGETQVYLDTLRIVIRITQSDGSIAGGTYIDEKLDNTLGTLLVPIDAADTLPEEYQIDTDQYEPDDNPGFEVELDSKKKQTFDRKITENDVDRFIFQLEEKEFVSFKVTTTSSLEVLLFKEGDDFPLATSNEPNMKGSLLLETELESGIYILEITGINPYATGNYTLTTSFSINENDTFEPDNSIANASSIKPGEKQERLLVPDDEDWVQVHAFVPGFYLISCKGNGYFKATTYIGNKVIKSRELNEKDTFYMGFFADNTPIYIRTTTTKDSETPLKYKLELDKLDPERIYPNSGKIVGEKKEIPLYYVLRILERKKYLLEYQASSEINFSVYSLPEMGEIADQNEFVLQPGDYLLEVDSNADDILFKFCISEETVQGESRVRCLE